VPGVQLKGGILAHSGELVDLSGIVGTVESILLSPESACVEECLASSTVSGMDSDETCAKCKMLLVQLVLFCSNLKLVRLILVRIKEIQIPMNKDG
jgi:hypothetical protein